VFSSSPTLDPSTIRRVSQSTTKSEEAQPENHHSKHAHSQGAQRAQFRSLVSHDVAPSYTPQSFDTRRSQVEMVPLHNYQDPEQEVPLNTETALWMQFDREQDRARKEQIKRREIEEEHAILSRLQRTDQMRQNRRRNDTIVSADNFPPLEPPTSPLPALPSRRHSSRRSHRSRAPSTINSPTSIYSSFDIQHTPPSIARIQPRLITIGPTPQRRPRNDRVKRG